MRHRATSWSLALGLVLSIPARAASADERIEAPRPEAETPAAAGSIAPSRADAHLPDWLLGLRVSGYVQAEYETEQDSQDETAQGGASLNKDEFVVRRARLRIDRVWDYASTTVEIDGNTNHGLAVGFRRAEVSVFVLADDGAPYVKAEGGLGDIDFGSELWASNRERLFMERSLVSQAFFPYEADIGARLSGGFGPFRYALSALNGQPFTIGSAVATTGDPNAGKDLVARFGLDLAPSEETHVVAGASFLRGRGFHQGTQATKSSVQWVDTNENSMIDAGELVGAPGTAATPSADFDRWAINADLRVVVTSFLGATTLYGEATAGVNMDRGMFLADPIASGGDVRELGYYAALTHGYGPFLAGIRYDSYDPNSDFFLKRQGKLLPSSNSLHTTSPVVGIKVGDHVRVSAQYDVNRNHLALDERGVPTNLADNRLTVRLQGEL